jgi:hypothetical protein
MKKLFGSLVKSPYRCKRCDHTIDMFADGIAIDGEDFYHLDCYVEKHNEEKEREHEG